MEEQEKVLMGQRELKRWHLMKMEVGKINLNAGSGKKEWITKVKKATA